MQTQCGPHVIGEEQRALSLQLREELKDILPFNDCNKLSDEDLSYRFLIARKWDVPAAATMLRSYLAWRAEEQLDTICTESFPEDFSRCMGAGYEGFDVEGRPVMWQKPNPTDVAYLLQNYDVPALTRWHHYVIERGRERYRLGGQDRLTIVLDVADIGLNVLTNLSAMSVFKEMTASDQAHFPEHMRQMFIINAPWFFSKMWNVVKRWLDERSQKKIQIWGSNYGQPLQEFIAPDQIPAQYGGQGLDWKSVPAEGAKYEPPPKERLRPPRFS
uniref:CRAL-TRIO domain-containing protein n=1 Tax=Eutreptiella gymnastica TaxID=73025 RepID=A0A6U8B962_9EUGL|mmetsp:Transcript_19150/g.33842  ORF Transcript_19150/g.33842 Transcript_19150/m.33842 type:complete len:273 (+) Transcript_19150:185-1003(+)